MNNQYTQWHQSYQPYIDKIDVNYGYELAKKLGAFRTNDVLGFRTVGSFAEHEAADFLEKEMANIGLNNIERYAYPVTAWTFRHAIMHINNETFQLSAYPSHCVIDEEVMVLDLGRACGNDMDPEHVKDKWLLLDINQRDDWWINYPATEAFFKGAKGIIAIQDGGYGEASDTALNVQNTSIPNGAGALSMSRKDATQLRSMMSDGVVTVHLNVSSILDEEGVAYNVFGSIAGASNEQVLMSAHYDAYFTGFQDNSAAVGLMFGIAKALCDAGIKPQKTLVFGALSAEEWGKSNTRYDWLTGSYAQMFHITPEWSEHTFANINFELPAMLEDECDWIRSSYELKRYLETFTRIVPNDGSVYPEGIKVQTPIETWSDDFSFEIAGVPATVSALKPEFSKSHYHSQLDDLTTYNEGAFHFHHVLYGMLMLSYDALDEQPLDFGERFKDMQAKLNDEFVARYTPYNFDERFASITAKAELLWLKPNQHNLAYRTLSRKLFRYITDNFISISWEDDVLHPFEQNQTNISILEGVIEGTLQDSHLASIDNNKYAAYFSEETVTYHRDNAFSDATQKMWGTDRIRSHCDLYSDKNVDLQRKLESEITHYQKRLEAMNTALIHVDTALAELLLQLS